MKYSCPICNSTAKYPIFIHKKWKIPVMKCEDCSHVFSSQFVEEREDSFKTNEERALYYLRTISSLRPRTMMDIGTPWDFFFLTNAHQQFPYAKKYALDLYDKEHPEYVTLLNDFPSNTTMDICTAFHVLEHVEKPHEFTTSIMNSSAYFIIEVPNCDTKKSMIESSCNPHMHFFNINSFKALFGGRVDNNIRFMIRTGKDMMWRKSVLVAYRLPEDCLIENQKQTSDDLLRTARIYLEFARLRLQRAIAMRAK